jgi:beta-lactamase regulating signal transducer with metallopeptidase domain
MRELFLNVVNMSLTASYVILCVILVRLLLKKAPKITSYALWCVVAFRLIIPFSIESVFSFIPRNIKAIPVPYDITYHQSPQTNNWIKAADSFINQELFAPVVRTNENILQFNIETIAYVWILGIVALNIYSLVSVLQLKRQLKNARLIERNTYEMNNLKTPFVFGLIKPKIYLPSGLDIEERGYILLHEQIHIRRKDHILLYILG